ncbi:hypothetical protein L1987_58160 [Smallanthus sonchifolius]|uniref:Uncharacterized protein n=1 Tax=Smallanthus sonchifolius TaxID=185202 RepID=A0ACB9DEG3_9ASTR|nr:hypothetical protein L1987_58160 [Smallanthus sonchifolius]
MFVFPANSKKTEQALLANLRLRSTVLMLDPFAHRKRDSGVRASLMASFGGGSGVTPSPAVHSGPLYLVILIILANRLGFRRVRLPDTSPQALGLPKGL